MGVRESGSGRVCREVVGAFDPRLCPNRGKLHISRLRSSTGRIEQSGECQEEKEEEKAQTNAGMRQGQGPGGSPGGSKRPWVPRAKRSAP